MEVERDAWVVNRAAVDAIIVVTADIKAIKRKAEDTATPVETKGRRSYAN